MLRNLKWDFLRPFKFETNHSPMLPSDLIVRGIRKRVRSLSVRQIISTASTHYNAHRDKHVFNGFRGRTLSALRNTIK